MRLVELLLIVVGFLATLAFMVIYGGGKSRWYKHNTGQAMMARAGGYALIMAYVLASVFGILPERQWVGLLVWGLVAATETWIAIVFGRERLAVERVRRAGRIKDGEIS